MCIRDSAHYPRSLPVSAPNAARPNRLTIPIARKVPLAMTGGGEVRMRTRASLRAGLMWAMGLFVVAYMAGLLLRGAGWGPVVDGWLRPVVDNWLELLTDWVPSAVCWLAVSRVGFRRWEVPLVAAAVTCFAAGDTYYVLMVAGACLL